MKAIAVLAGRQNSVHLAELPKPSLDEVPDGRGVLVRVLRAAVVRVLVTIAPITDRSNLWSRPNCALRDGRVHLEKEGDTQPGFF